MRSAILSEVHTDEFTGLLKHLLRDGLLDIPAAKAAMLIHRQKGISIASYLVQAKLLSSQTLFDYCREHFNLPVFYPKHDDTHHPYDALIRPELICHYRVIPLYRDSNSLHLGITDPTDHVTLAAIGFHTGLPIHPMLISEEILDNIINTHYRPHLLSSQLDATLSKITPTDPPTPRLEHVTHDDEPVIELVDHLIQDAIDKHISDIHIEPYEHDCRIRFRRDGLLYTAATLPTHLILQITTRLKIMANMNIAERRLPQDGRFQWHKKSKIDIRANTCPTLFGEKMVLRLLDIKNIPLDIDRLGFTEIQKKNFLSALSQPQGLLLVTGPTGSGKTITLYTALQHLNQIEKNVSSVEDPVEIELKGINQVNIHPKIGLDFATVLRTFLRQDPDVILVGEIRDLETARMAMSAAQTGHLVLSTLHTNSAAESMTRLQSMGIVAYHLIHALLLIIAQRLVRKLCVHCKKPEIISLANDSFPVYQAVGCDQCHQGYQGRIGIFECIAMTEKISQSILSGASIHEITHQIKQERMMLLWEAGLEKVKQGLTSFAEIVRVLGHQDE